MDMSAADVMVAGPSADTTPPVVTGVSVSSASIDVTPGPKMLEVSVSFTDDSSGFDGTVRVNYKSPSRNKEVQCNLYTYTGGNDLKGSKSGTAVTKDDSTGLCTWSP